MISDSSAPGVHAHHSSRAPADRGAAPVSVLIADDQLLVRAGLRAILEAEPGIAVAGEASDGYEAVELVAKRHPAVALMDIRMPGIDGLEATRRIRQRPELADVAVLMLTTYDLNEYVYEALRAGASGFLLKDASPEQIAAAVRVVAAGEALIAPAITKRLIEQFARTAPPLAVPPALERLTAREREVLRLVARGLSNAEIAEELVIAEATVKTHVTHLLAKLDLRDRVHAVVLAYEAGIVSPGT